MSEATAEIGLETPASVHGAKAKAPSDDVAPPPPEENGVSAETTAASDDARPPSPANDSDVHKPESTDDPTTAEESDLVKKEEDSVETPTAEVDDGAATQSTEEPQAAEKVNLEDAETKKEDDGPKAVDEPLSVTAEETHVLESFAPPAESPRESFDEISLGGDTSAEKSNGLTSPTDEKTPEKEKSDSPTAAPVKKGADVKTAAETASDYEGLSGLRTTVIHSSAESAEETFKRLRQGLEDAHVPNADIVNSVFQVLVGGPVDMESKFIIQSADSISRMVDLLDDCSSAVQAELWSVFTAMARKSNRNLEASASVRLTDRILDRLPKADDVVGALLIELLGVLSTYSVDVKEMKHFLAALKLTPDGKWPRHAEKLVYVVRGLPRREGPESFFSFPGTAQAAVALPPIPKWPTQGGWTFAAWLRMDPMNSVNFEKEKPFVYSFWSSKAAQGYSLSFMGNCLVVTVTNRKGTLTRCVRTELRPRRWTHVALAHVYSRWGKSEVQAFVDGQLVQTLDLAWPVTTSEAFDKCLIGLGGDGDANAAFCGQMGAIYVFTEALTLQQVNSMFCLGPGYQSQFRYEQETELPEGYKKFLFDGRLAASMMFAYVPRNCDGQLCLESSPRSNASHFLHISHAVMRNDVKVVRTHSVQASLQSVGGIQMLLPLFAQLDAPVQKADGSSAVDFNICSTLIGMLGSLLEASPGAQQQMYQNKGFLLIAHHLGKASRAHVNMSVLESILGLGKFLLTLPSAGIPLLRQLFDHVLLNPPLWIHSPAKVQQRLYSSLSADFLSHAAFAGSLRRTSTILQILHALKYFYWMTDPTARSGFKPRGVDGPRPPKDDLIAIRSSLLHFVRLLFLRGPTGPASGEGAAAPPTPAKDDEFQALLNFVSTVNEDDNLYDVLELLITLMAEEPSALIPAFERKAAIRPLFKLLASPNQLLRLPALKLLAHFLSRSTNKRKADVMEKWNLFSLLTERLLLNASHLSMPTYNVLFELLTELVTPEVQFTPHAEPDDSVRFENPALLKVIGNLIAQSRDCEELRSVRQLFLADLISLCSGSRENRRAILQMSVWQEWLISLHPIYPTNAQESQIADMVSRVFSLLLHHAVRLEYGGWRVWVDTLAIVHSKVAFEKFKREVGPRLVSSGKSLRKTDSQASKKSSPREASDLDDVAVSELVASLVERVVSGQDLQPPSSAANDEESPRPMYRTPEFRWSAIHLRLLSDLLLSIETDISAWKSACEEEAAAAASDPRLHSSHATRQLVDYVNASENAVFVVNSVHVLSQLADNLVMACGGLLPLLAAATSPNSELEIGDATQQGLSQEAAVSFLVRFLNLADVFVFTSALTFADLEQEKNMPAGGILRQTLRLVTTGAVRNILACRKEEWEETPAAGLGDKAAAKRRAIRRIVLGLTQGDWAVSPELVESTVPIHNVDHLLQEMDLTRLKAAVYRDVEENRQAQFLSLAVVYFLSVLMVSRYRDILEPPVSPSPFTDSVTNTSHSPSPQPSPSKASSTPPKAAETKPASQDTPPKDGDNKENNNERTNGHSEEDDPKPDTVGTERPAIAAIDLSGVTTDTSDEQPKTPGYNASQLPVAETLGSISGRRQSVLSDSLMAALQSSAPLFRELMGDFQGYLQKTLLGTHGQEIMNDARVLTTLKNSEGSVIELVMLLCSQEWQTSLQKHAGLAFIELVNEGRLMAHATRDHLLRVANEADFILNRLRAEDVAKHAQFEAACAESGLLRRDEERSCDHLITAARRRDTGLASRLYGRLLTLLDSPHGAWAEADASPRATYWKLDVWEDDSRRRKRFVPNALGSSHPEATLKAALQHGGSAEEVEAARTRLASSLAEKRLALAAGPEADLVDASDISSWAATDDDAGPPTAEGSSFMTRCRLVCPGLVVPGTMSVTSSELYFDCDEEDPEFKAQDPKVLRYCENLHGRWHFGEIRAIFLRRYLLRNTALELFLASRTAIMLAFPDHKSVKEAVNHLPRVGVGVKYGLPQSRKASLMTPRQLYAHSDMPQKWQRREISNFDYLMFLNTIAGRTYNDLNQYPVFPWILSNYESEELDLNQPTNYRDLSKPMGALTASRKAAFEERYSGWESSSVPAFHYGTHYSTGAFTLNWLLRLEPFTSMFLSLQSGKFDQSDRTFHGMGEAWASVQRDSHDVKELIPEHFFLPEMFRNSNDYELGRRSDGAAVGDVVLPPWAASAEDFVAVHRQALESELVSCQLHQWLDLIFGYKQRGPEAVRATNVFYYLTYEGAVDLPKVEDPILREALENQIRNFGQTPSQLLTEPHPPRQSVMAISPMIFNAVEEDLCMMMKFISNSPVVHLSPNTYTQLPNPTLLSVAANLGFALNRWNNNYSGPQGAAIPGAGGEGSDAPPNLPLTVDPLLASGNPANPLQRRSLGDPFDQRLEVRWSNFASSVNSRFIFACGYPDHSFRVIETDYGKVRQVVYGHADVVSVIGRSECNLMSDCYLATGSRDCTLLLWHWNAKAGLVAGEYGQAGERAVPRAVLTGHDAEITCVAVSAEHGLVVSGSREGALLVHTTAGELLRSLEGPAGARVPRSLVLSRECLLLAAFDQGHLALFSASSARLLRSQDTGLGLTQMALSRDGEYVVAGSEEGIVRVIRLSSLAALYDFPATEAPVRSCAIAQNHRFILAGLATGAIVVFNVDFNKWHHEYKDRYPHRKPK